MTPEKLYQVYLNAYNFHPKGNRDNPRRHGKHMAGLLAVQEALAAEAPRPEEKPQWKLLDDAVSTPSTQHILRSQAMKPFTHWFTTMHAGDFYYYKVEVPAFDPDQLLPQGD